MVNLRTAQTGNRVYRGVGQSPNLGPVSGKGASGYIQREQRKKKPQVRPLGGMPNTNRPLGGVRPVGNDGKSDSRSGVAKQALNRSQTLPTPKSKGTSQIPSERNVSAAPANSSMGAPVAPAPAAPQVQASPVGTLQLPYDQSYSAEQVQLVTQANQDLLDLQNEEQQNDMEFTTATRDADLAYKALQKQMLSGAGGRGTVFSSMYGQQAADGAGQYSNQLADLTSRNAQFKSTAAQRRAAIQTSLSTQIQALTQQYANELATKQAGELGYGTDQGSVVGGGGGGAAPAAAAPAAPSGGGGGGNGGGGNNNNGGGNKPGSGVGNDRGPRPSAKHVWRDGRWIPWSQTAAGQRGEKQPKD